MHTPRNNKGMKRISACGILIVALMATAIAQAAPASSSIVDGKQYGGAKGGEDDKIGGH
jgi:hypothetical protein